MQIQHEGKLSESQFSQQTMAAHINSESKSQVSQIGKVGSSTPKDGTPQASMPAVARVNSKKLANIRKFKSMFPEAKGLKNKEVLQIF